MRAFRPLGLAIAALAIALLPFGPAADAQDRERGLVLGYYVPYDTTSWASLESHADQIDVVAAQWVTLDACGSLGSRDDQTLKQFAHEHGIKVVPSLFTVSGALNHRLLTDDPAREAALQNIVSYTVDEGYDGFDLDLEGVDAADRDALSSFVGDLAARLHAQQKLLTLALPPKERDTTTGWAGAFDYAALGAEADLVTIMAYEYRGPFSGPGSVAPFDWVSRVTAFASGQMPTDRLLLGLAFYGYDWNTTSGGTVSLGYARAMALADQVQADVTFDAQQQSMTFSYVADGSFGVPKGPSGTPLSHVITTRSQAPCDVGAPSAPPAKPPPTPEAGVPQTHEVWLEDGASAAARLGLVFNYRLRGVATWRLGLEDPAVWPVLDAWRQGV